MKVLALRAVRWLSVSVALTLAFAFCDASASEIKPPTHTQRPTMRELPKSASYVLRVLYLEDDRLPTLSGEQLDALARKLEGLLQTWFQYSVEVRIAGRRELREYFAAQKDAFTRQASFIANTQLDPAQPHHEAAFNRAISGALAGRSLAFIAEHLRCEPLTSQAEAFITARALFRSRLQAIERIPVGQGASTPLVEPARRELNSFAHWVALLREQTDADLILTNSLIVGADREMPIYVIGRGGVTTGVTDNNDRSSYQVATAIGLYPFLSTAPEFATERGPIATEDLLDVIASFCLHEFGHFFLRYNEHYDHPKCVHVAPRGFDYVGWHRAIREAGPCPLPHQKLRRFDSP